MKLSTILFFILSSYASKAQTKIINLSLTDTTQNLFYIDVENVIKITGENLDSSKRKLVFLGGGGMFKKKSPEVYIVTVRYQTDNAHIWITENNKPVFKKNFRVRNLGFPPIASFNGFRDTNTTTSKLLANPVLQVSIPGCLYKLNFSVLNYKASLKHGKDNTTIVVNNNKLSEKQIEILKSLTSGDEIFFEEIVATTANFRNIKCLPFWIKIE